MKPSKHNISDAMIAYLARLRETGQMLRRQMSPYLQMHKKVQEHWRGVQENLRQSQENLWKSIQPFQQKLEKAFRGLPERIPNALLILGEHGWFMDFEMPMPALWVLQEALIKGDVDGAEEALVGYFREKLVKIEKSIAKAFPHRAKIIGAAFKAHGRTEYELSIPVFLAQADGICKEVVGEQLFMTRNKKPRTAIYVETITSGTFRRALLFPLERKLPIGASERERDEGFTELNRHQVLHGESLDYGTEVNSLKSISLLNYVAHALKEDKG